MVEEVQFVIGLREANDVEARFKAIDRAINNSVGSMKVAQKAGGGQAQSLTKLNSAATKTEREIKQLVQAQARGRITSGQLTGEFNKMSARLNKMGFDKAQSQVFSYGQAARKTAARVEEMAAASGKAEKANSGVKGSTEKTASALDETKKSVGKTIDVTQKMRDQFLGTANTIAILDGPLGGIASRFSAFGVLLGRTGLLMAGVGLAATAFFTVLGKGIASFVQFEAQTARINAVLRATENRVGKTTQEIEKMASGIALATLESEQGVRKAASALLTFRNVSGEAFEGTLKAATDLAALGFGTVESATKQLAKALQDPRQGLTSLSRAGVTFTRQQRELIISLVDTGQRAEAMSRVLENVNSQVGGAGEAAARNTMAGQFDTIGQAFGTAARELGAFVVEAVRADDVLEALADSSARFLERREPLPLDEQIRQQEAIIAEARRRQQADAERVAEIRERISLFEDLNADREALQNLTRELPKLQQELAILEETSSDSIREFVRKLEELEQKKRSVIVGSVLNEADDRRSGITNTLASAQSAIDSIGLSQAQERAQKKLAEAGLAFSRSDIPGILEKTVGRLREARVEGIKFERIMDQVRKVLEEGLEAGDKLTEAFEQRTIFNELDQSARALASQNEILAAQIPLIRDGVSATEARQQAQTQIERAIAEEAAANEENTQAVRDAAKAKLDALDAAEDLTREERRATTQAESLESRVAEVRDRTREAANAARTLFENLGRSLRSLRAQEAGVRAAEQTIARGGSERDVAIDRAAAEARATAEGPDSGIQAPNPEARAREIARFVRGKAQEAAKEFDLAQRESAISDAFKPESETGGAGSSRAAEQVKTLKDVTKEMERQIRVRIDLAQASDKERVVLETISEITDRLDEQGANYTDEEIRRAAERIAKREEEAERADRVREANERVQQSAEDAFTSFITGAEGARDAIDNMLDSLLNLLAQEVSGSIFDGLMGGTSFGDAISSGISFLTGGGSGGSANSGIGSVRPRLPTADGGGYTGPGPRSGGLDGKGGFMMMMHPQETIVDHTKGRGQGGQVVNNIQVIAPPGSDVQEERQQNGSGGEDLTILIDQAVSGLARDPSSRLSRTLNTGFGISPTRRSR